MKCIKSSFNFFPLLIIQTTPRRFTFPTTWFYQEKRVLLGNLQSRYPPPPVKWTMSNLLISLSLSLSLHATNVHFECQLNIHIIRHQTEWPIYVYLPLYLSTFLSIYLSIYLYIYIYIHLWLYRSLWTSAAFAVFYTQSVGLLGRRFSPPQGRYLHTEQHIQKVNEHRHPFVECDSNPGSQC
jgi:hypothetical protein